MQTKGVLQGPVPLDLVTPATDPIGVRLLQKMGWKPGTDLCVGCTGPCVHIDSYCMTIPAGQGVGPRVAPAQLARQKRLARMHGRYREAGMQCGLAGARVAIAHGCVGHIQEAIAMPM